MADIAYNLVAEGWAEGSEKVREFSESVDEARGTSDEFASSATAAGVASLAQGQKLEQLGGTIGQVGALVGRLNPEWARFGATIGSVGSQIPALTGALGPVAQAMAGVTLAVDLGSQAWEQWGGHVRTADEVINQVASDASAAEERIRGLVSALREREERSALVSGSAGVDPTAAALQEANDAISEQEHRRQDLVEELRRLGTSEDTLRDQRRQASALDRVAMHGASVDMLEAIDAIDTALATDRQRREALQESLAFAREAARVSAQGAADIARFSSGAIGRSLGPQEGVTHTANDDAARARHNAQRSTRGPSDLRTPEQQAADVLAAQEGAEAAQRAFEKESRAANEAALSARLALDAWAEGLDKVAEGSRLAREAQEQLANEQKTLEENAARAADTFRDAWRNGVDAVIAALEEANAAAEKAGTTQVSAMEAAGQAALAASKEMGDALLGGVAKAFAGAAKAAIKGEQSFGDALAGMLEDTLYSIGTQAIVLSVFEFARAIASAASQDWVGAAAHAGAGAAYAAVGALAFGGGAALSAASTGGAKSSGAAASPASPQPGNDNGSSGTTNIYNITFGGQVVTAATHAELGRQLESSIGQGQSRWGRAA